MIVSFISKNNTILLDNCRYTYSDSVRMMIVTMNVDVNLILLQSSLNAYSFIVFIAVYLFDDSVEFTHGMPHKVLGISINKK